MFTHSTRRWLAGIGVAGAFVAASATPALAEPAVDDLLLYANDALIAPGGEARSVVLLAFTDALPDDVTVTVDRHAVTGFATVTLSDKLKGCTETDAVITCDLKGADLIDYVLDLTVKATDKAEAGAKGDLLLSLASKGRETVSTRSTIEVGEGVDLQAQEQLNVSGAPGATVKTPVGIANIGDTTTHGAVLFLATMASLSPAQRYGNCSSTEEFGSQLTVCRFDDEIAAGDALQLDGSAGLKIAADAWAPSRQYGQAIWFTKDDFEEFAKGLLPGDGWQQGTGDALKLVPAPAKQASVLRQTDKDPKNNYTFIQASVTGNQRADLAATGAELPGAVGKTVTAKIGFVNNGPAMTNSYTPGEIVTGTRVTVPAGAVVVKAPRECSPGTAEEPTGGYGEPGGRVYFCEWYDTLHKGDAAVFEFGLRIDKVAGTPGEVKLFHFDLEQGDQVADLNPKNDMAALVIKGAGNGGNGGNGGGGGGGTLPITGSSTALIAGLGALLLAAGAGGYVVARRRKTRFVA
ncbi:LPXTG cell wall anchor domain-containing protein [Micromonospora sp. 4G57]|uniref:LPXTG cell wall anchor domain-containing protein n=1 Tax=Micromonospora sicca TaxID=2202420 RepID=A0ABU5JG08_9ACTN|nr:MULTISPECIES: LPXTG cell wall anchor domain-containing protein [unclassified Micromonospora]MDZ5445547.1 LPXTG cell wall anchor domain-containing protein [Micromonospora sp. 4G57]MDZ5491521.1 LPXTG cell wall anchor domain-containing protein [Micromonospora sp. 4G53]